MKKTILCLSIATLLTACNSSNSTAPSISVTTVSGTSLTLTDTFTTDCYTAGGSDVKEAMSFTGATVSYVKTDFNTSDGSCGAAISPQNSYSATVTTSVDSAITGWVNGAGITVTAPMALDNSGILAPTESYTELTYTITETNMADLAVGDEIPRGYIVDDTTATQVLYRLNDTLPAKGSIADPFIKAVTPVVQ